MNFAFKVIPRNDKSSLWVVFITFLGMNFASQNSGAVVKRDYAAFTPNVESPEGILRGPEAIL